MSQEHAAVVEEIKALKNRVFVVRLTKHLNIKLCIDFGQRKELGNISCCTWLGFFSMHRI